MGFLLKVRDASKVGAFPLRGVIMNTWDMTPAAVLKNKELGDLLALVHKSLNLFFVAVLAGHIGAALKHHFIDKDDIDEIIAEHLQNGRVVERLKI